MNEGYLALLISIFRKTTPDDAFRILDGKPARRAWTAAELCEIKDLRENGATWAEIGEMYGVAAATAQKRFIRFINGEVRKNDGKRKRKVDCRNIKIANNL